MARGGHGLGMKGAAWAVAMGLLLATVAALLVMGRVPICTCGIVRLWGGGVNTPDNSQQIADWYSFSHVIHGMIFYAALRWLLPRLSPSWRLAVAVAIECGWEILENSPIIIDRYRAATIAIGYTGDSILNSVSDVLMMALGFLIAYRLPWRWTVALAILFEIGTLVIIRDNLTLNILMLVSPLEAIREWQAAL